MFWRQYVNILPRPLKRSLEYPRDWVEAQRARRSSVLLLQEQLTHICARLRESTGAYDLTQPRVGNMSSRRSPYPLSRRHHAQQLVQRRRRLVEPLLHGMLARDGWQRQHGHVEVLAQRDVVLEVALEESDG